MYILPESIKPGKRYRVVQVYSSGTHVAVEGTVILRLDDYVAFQGAGKFKVTSGEGIYSVGIDSLDD